MSVPRTDAAHRSGCQKKVARGRLLLRKSILDGLDLLEDQLLWLDLKNLQEVTKGPCRRLFERLKLSLLDRATDQKLGYHDCCTASGNPKASN